MNEINIATIIAAKYTDGRTTKDGHPSILHALEVGTLLKQAGLKFLVVAGILHDVLEDSEGMYTSESLLDEGITEMSVVLIENLSRLQTLNVGYTSSSVESRTHNEYIQDIIKAGEYSIRIKQADSISNLRPADFRGSDSLRERTLYTLNLLAEKYQLPAIWMGHFNVQFALDKCKDRSKYKYLWSTR